MKTMTEWKKILGANYHQDILRNRSVDERMKFLIKTFKPKKKAEIARFDKALSKIRYDAQQIEAIRGGKKLFA